MAGSSLPARAAVRGWPRDGARTEDVSGHRRDGDCAAARSATGPFSTSFLFVRSRLSILRRVPSWQELTLRTPPTGHLAQRTYADREGIERTVTELQVDEVGVSLRFGTAQFTRRGQRGAAYSPQDGDAETGTSQAGPTYDADNPWGLPAEVN